MPDWEALYQAKDTGWDRGEVSETLHTWLEKDAFSGATSVLVPGCGRGYEVVELAKRGFSVTALDIAPSAIAYLDDALAKAGVQAKTHCVDIFDDADGLLEEKYDVVFEQTCLCAIAPKQREAYAEAVLSWLKPEGKLLLAMMQTGDAAGPPFHCDWLDMRRLFADTHWAWQEEPPFIISRGRPSPRFELGFALTKLGK